MVVTLDAKQVFAKCYLEIAAGMGDVFQRAVLIARTVGSILWWDCLAGINSRVSRLQMVGRSGACWDGTRPGSVSRLRLWTGTGGGMRPGPCLRR
jgi:hypothetical protein